MRRSERILGWAGAVLVSAAVAAVTAILVVNGGRVAPDTRSVALVPADIAWTVYLHCSIQADTTLTLEGAVAIEQERDIMRISVIDSPAPAEDVTRYEGLVNDCLAAYPAEDPAEIDYTGERIDADAERLLVYDVAYRWLQPCLAGHGVPLTVVPGVRDYLGELRWPWNDVYGFPPDAERFDDFVRARIDCGSGHEPYGP